MKNKKINIKLFIMFISMGFLLSSCLKHNLPDYPEWGKTMISNVYVEYRYNSNEDYNGKPVVNYERLDVSQNIDTTSGEITLDITVPQASGSFTNNVRNQVSQDDLILYFDLSTAAKMTPVGDTPGPGYSTDLTEPQKYIVTAADGSQKTWTITVNSFTK